MSREAWGDEGFGSDHEGYVSLRHREKPTPGYRDALEAAAKVVEDFAVGMKSSGIRNEMLDLVISEFEGTAAEIRALPVPDADGKEKAPPPFGSGAHAVGQLVE